jgi:hypothetical protein
LDGDQAIEFLNQIRARLIKSDNYAILTHSSIDRHKAVSEVLKTYNTLTEQGIFKAEKHPNDKGISFLVRRDIPKLSLSTGQVFQTFIYKDSEELYFKSQGFDIVEQVPISHGDDKIERVASVLKST